LPFDDWAVDRYMINHPGINISLYQSGLAMHHLNLKPYLDRIKIPVLVIFGQQDGTVPVSDGQLVAQRVPGSQIVLIDHCGHFPMYEQTQQYLDALLPFLTQ
jgi:2-hydroxy-6-oxonona-2,4-dienedioate hydrolase